VAESSVMKTLRLIINSNYRRLMRRGLSAAA
jgi:hypothetical protein